MKLTPREIEKLMLHTAGELAKTRKNRGVKLNYVESIAYISSELMELARDGKTVKELMQLGTEMLYIDDVMEGVAEMVNEVQIEATFPDGTKLVTVHNPIRYKEKYNRVPGEIISANKEIEINGGLEKKKITVTNTGDRAIQVGSHIHFFEINKFMKFDRKEAYGYRLNIPSGTAIRFEADETKEVELVELGGNKIVRGINNLTDAQINSTTVTKSLLNAKLKGFE